MGSPVRTYFFYDEKLAAIIERNKIMIKFPAERRKKCQKRKCVHWVGTFFPICNRGLCIRRNKKLSLKFYADHFEGEK